jgi:hypothetical protein
VDSFQGVVHIAIGVVRNKPTIVIQSKLGHPTAPHIPTRRWRNHCISKSTRLGNGRFWGSLVVKVNVSPERMGRKRGVEPSSSRRVIQCPFATKSKPPDDVGSVRKINPASKVVITWDLPEELNSKLLTIM